MRVIKIINVRIKKYKFRYSHIVIFYIINDNIKIYKFEPTHIKPII